MKRRIVVLLALGLSLCFTGRLFAGDITITAGGTSGSWFIAGSAFQDGFSQNIPDAKFNVIPGGGAANPIRVNKGDAQVGFTYATNAKSAVTGTDPYKEKMENIRAMINLQILQYLTFAALEKTPVNSFQEWIEKKATLRICPGPRSMGGWLSFRRMLTAYGTSQKETEKWGSKYIHAGWSESVQQVLDGHADAISTQAPVRVPFLVDFAQARPVKFFSIKASVLQVMADQYGYAALDMPAGTYKGQDSPVPTVADSVVLLVNKDVPEGLVYQMVKVICENKPKWVNTHAMFNPFEPDQAAKSPIQLHPGAVKYYKEKGYMK
jgi:TRAP transporter TAXI family solute receptor